MRAFDSFITAYVNLAVYYLVKKFSLHILKIFLLTNEENGLYYHTRLEYKT